MYPFVSGVLREKLGEEREVRLPKSLPYLWSKSAIFPYPIKNSWRTFVDSFIDNDKNLTFSKERAQFKA